MRKADRFITFMCRLSWILGAAASWNPQGLSRPVKGLLYIYHRSNVYENIELFTEVAFINKHCCKKFINNELFAEVAL